MPTTLPVTFVAASLPSNWKGTPQEFLSAIADRLSLEAEDELSFFVVGSVAPTSDVGPWLKDDQTWWVWDEDTGAYIPEILDSLSLRYIVSVSEPDPADYTFWIKVTGYGVPQGVFTYAEGAWVDVYEFRFADYSTTTEMNAAIDAAVDAALLFYPSVASATTQTIVVDGNFHKVSFPTELADPESCYDTTLYRYTAPVDGVYEISANIQADNDGGTASGMEMTMNIYKNGAPSSIVGGAAVGSPPGARWYPDASGGLPLSAGDYVEVHLSANDGVLSGSLDLSNGQFFVKLVQAT